MRPETRRRLASCVRRPVRCEERRANPPSSPVYSRRLARVPGAGGPGLQVLKNALGQARSPARPRPRIRIRTASGLRCTFAAAGPTQTLGILILFPSAAFMQNRLLPLSPCHHRACALCLLTSSCHGQRKPWPRTLTSGRATLPLHTHHEDRNLERATAEDFVSKVGGPASRSCFFPGRLLLRDELAFAPEDILPVPPETLAHHAKTSPLPRVVHHRCPVILGCCCWSAD